MEEKTRLRRETLAKRDALSAADRRVKSSLICERLLSWPVYRRASTVLLYAGVKSEVETKELTIRSLAAGQRVVMPRCLPATRDLLLVPICSWDDLETSYFGLLEPPPPAVPLTAQELDLVVVPGVAFDPEGYRLGYGGGYYDRLLARLKGVPTVALAFEMQIVPRVPRSEHDQPVDYIATEERLLRGREGQPGVEV